MKSKINVLIEWQVFVRVVLLARVSRISVRLKESKRVESKLTSDQWKKNKFDENERYCLGLSSNNFLGSVACSNLGRQFCPKHSTHNVVQFRQYMVQLGSVSQQRCETSLSNCIYARRKKRPASMVPRFDMIAEQYLTNAQTLFELARLGSG